MRILSMAATFGGLEKRVLAPGEGLNVIAAPNEGGKSTWCAFLKAMLYGIDTRDRDKKGYLADKNRYQPWSGAPMEGELRLEWQGREVTIRRGPRGSVPFGAFSAVYTASGEAVPGLTAANCGQLLTGVGREVYERSAFIGQGGSLAVTAAPELEKRIAALVTGGREDVSFAQTEQRLREMRNRRRVNRSVGRIPELESELARLEEQLAAMREISAQGVGLSARRRALGQEKERLEGERQLHRRLAQQELDRRYAQAEDELLAARERLTALERELTRFGPQPEEEVLLRAQGQLSFLKVLDDQIAAGKEELKGAQEDYVQVQIALQGGPFSGRTAREAEELAQSALKSREQQLAQAEELKKRAGLLTALALLGLAGAGACWALAAGTVRLAACGGLVLLAGVLLALSARSRAGGKTAAVRGQEEMARLGAEDEDALNALLASYRRRWERAEEANGRCAQTRGQVNDQLARRENTYNDLMDFVHTFAPEVSTLNGCSAALSRALKLGHGLAMARQQVDERQLRLNDLLAQGGRRETGGGQLPAPARSREETDLALADAARQLEQTDRQLNQILGRQKALGDPAELEARREQVQRELERKGRELQAIDLALEALTRANARLRERFSPELNRRAGAYLEQLTGGRYDRLTLTREMEGAAALRGEALTRDALYLSRGTFDQLYLAVRLAVCALCLPQRPPVVLDDALSDFDDGRARLALELLRRLAGEQQVLLFTCHGREERLLAGAEDVTFLTL